MCVCVDIQKISCILRFVYKGEKKVKISIAIFNQFGRISFISSNRNRKTQKKMKIFIMDSALIISISYSRWIFLLFLFYFFKSNRNHKIYRFGRSFYYSLFKIRIRIGFKLKPLPSKLEFSAILIWSTKAKVQTIWHHSEWMWRGRGKLFYFILISSMAIPKHNLIEDIVRTVEKFFFSQIGTQRLVLEHLFTHRRTKCNIWRPNCTMFTHTWSGNWIWFVFLICCQLSETNIRADFFCETHIFNKYWNWVAAPLGKTKK